MAPWPPPSLKEFNWGEPERASGEPHTGGSQFNRSMIVAFSKAYARTRGSRQPADRTGRPIPQRTAPYAVQSAAHVSSTNQRTSIGKKHRPAHTTPNTPRHVNACSPPQMMPSTCGRASDPDQRKRKAAMGESPRYPPQEGPSVQCNVPLVRPKSGEVPPPHALDVSKRSYTRVYVGANL